MIRCETALTGLLRISASGVAGECCAEMASSKISSELLALRTEDLRLGASSSCMRYHPGVTDASPSH